ncbi:hypothetical protein LZ30DRAFT_691962 [Colletotrichum cereale]|nr:hypothetical protein LZ30DRAFT_691962 [Colletotrichum cereale]
MSTSQASVVVNGKSMKRSSSDQQSDAAETRSCIANYLTEHRDLYERLHTDKEEDDRVKAHQARASDASPLYFTGVLRVACPGPHFREEIDGRVTVLIFAKRPRSRDRTG